MAIKIECDMCGRTITNGALMIDGELRFEGCVVEFRDAGVVRDIIADNGQDGLYYLCRECSEHLKKKATGWYDNGV